METIKLNLLDQTIELVYSDFGQGKTYLLLHPGGGQHLMLDFAQRLGQHARVILPVHPGFDTTPRPDWCHRVADLATLYTALIARLQLKALTIIGNSLGGWIGAEIVCRQPASVKSIVLLNAVGLPPTEAYGAITDLAQVPPQERSAYQFYQPERFMATPPTPEDALRMRSNLAVMQVYAGDPYMHNPCLPVWLRQACLPALILWGEEDRIVSTQYGRQFADLMPQAAFHQIPASGHYLQLEQPERVLDYIDRFTAQWG